MFVVVKPDTSITNTQYAIWEMWLQILENFRIHNDQSEMNMSKILGIVLSFFLILMKIMIYSFVGVFKQVSKTKKNMQLQPYYQPLQFQNVNSK